MSLPIAEPGFYHSPVTLTYRAWLVDLDGTLYRATPLRLAMAAELMLREPTRVDVIRAFRREHERLRKELQDAVQNPFQLQLDRTASNLQMKVAEVSATIQRWMIDRPGKWLRLFRRRKLFTEIAHFRRYGGKTAIVSDYPARGKLAALGAEGLFDVVVANGEPGGPGRLKPWPDGYLDAARRLAVTPGECLVVGDRDDADGMAARAAGMDFRRI